MEMIEIVEKLIGKIETIGETNTDEKRFENLKEFGNLTEIMLSKLHSVAKDEDCYEYSRKRSGRYARELLEGFAAEIKGSSN